MKWMRFRVRTTSQAEDILVSAMEDIGLCGAQIEDHIPLSAAEKERMFVDILPMEPEDDGSAVLSFYVEETREGEVLLDGKEYRPLDVKRRMEEVIASLRSFSDVIGEGTITLEETEDLDWVNNWKQYFHSFWIDDILVIPSWEEMHLEDRQPCTILHIDPGTAFGTGAHETTQLCIRQIRRYLKDTTRILDIGTGSGILSILALKLGAEFALGTELDPGAFPAIEMNRKANDIDPLRFPVLQGNLVNDPDIQIQVGVSCYDIVVANILAEVLLPLTPAAVRTIKPGGVFITSGILEGKEDLVSAAMRENGLKVVDITSQGEWRCVIGQKPLEE